MVGDILRHWRKIWQKAHGRRVADAVDVLGVSRPTLYLWESGRGRVDPIDLRRALELYGAPEIEIARALKLRSMPDEPSGAHP